MDEDHIEQQSMEIEALESIFMDDLQEVTDSVPSGWQATGKVYKLVLNPQLEEDLPDEYPLQAELVFAHTPAYPDEPPLVKARGVRGMADADAAALQAEVDSQVEANLGLPMVYALVMAAQEWVNQRGAAMAVPSYDPAAERRRMDEAEEARVAALRAHGTAVTPETFAAWKERFDAEVALAKAAISDPAAAAAAAGRAKLTGRQWFQQHEAQHIEVEEPELGDDDEDAGSWSGSEGGAEEGGEELEDSDDDDDDLLDEMLAGVAGA